MSAKSPDPEGGLTRRLIDQIRTAGSIPFSSFMEQALYDAQDGYYASGRAGIGRGGDFFTSVSVGPVFGRILAGQLVEMWQALGRPEDFAIVEQGAYDGRLAADVLEALGEEHRFPYRIVEPFKALRDRQRATLEGRPVTWHARLEELPDWTGVHFSNELFDAFPVDLVQSDGGTWHELHVGWEDGGFVWRRAGQYQGLPLPQRPEGYTTEVQRGYGAFFRTLSEKLRSGFVLAMDYGMTTESLLATHRTEGTLSCYRSHRRDDRPLEDPGDKDITAHVDFTRLASTAKAAGFSLEGFTDQHHFLVGAASDWLRAMDGQVPDAESRKTLRSLQTLLHPETMGRQFHALLLGKNLPSPARLAGFQFARPGILEA